MPILHWLTRDEDLRAATHVPYRLLEEARDLSAGDPDSGNLLIQGDNLEALKALLPFYAGRMKCIHIDPPYNTRSAFEHYDDNLEHTRWLAMMWPRLELLHDLLADDGSIWVSIDDNEGHYLKVVMDEVFGRRNFIATVIWRKNYSPKSSARHFSSDHDYILIFSKNADAFQPNLMPRTERQNKAYKNPDDDPRGLWRPNNLAARNYYSKGTYAIRCPSGRLIEGPPAGSYWRISEERFREMDRDGRIWWGRNGNNVPAPKIYLNEVRQGVVPQTFWNHEEVGHTQDAKKEIVNLFGDAHQSPHFKYQMTPNIPRYTRCSISIRPNASINARTRYSGQFGTCSYSINPWRNSECVRYFAVFTFNHRSYPRLSPAAPNSVNNAIANALSSSIRSRRCGREMRIDDSPIPKRMSLMSRKLVSIPQRVPSYRISVRVLTVRSLDTTHHGSFISRSCTHTTVPTSNSCASVTFASRNVRARPPAPTHCAASRRSPLAWVTE